MRDESHHLQISAVFGFHLFKILLDVFLHCHKCLCGHVVVILSCFHIISLHVTISNLLSGVCSDCLLSLGF